MSSWRGYRYYPPNKTNIVVKEYPIKSTILPNISDELEPIKNIDDLLNTYNKLKQISIDIDNIVISNDGKTIVILTSKIITSNNVLNYSKDRSIYSSNTRFEQTLNTIHSIRKRIENAYIVLCDNSELPEVMSNIILNAVDKFININNDELDFATNILPYKWCGENTQVLLSIKHLIDDRIPIKNIFKISGRYIINNNFNINLYNTQSIFKKHKDRDNWYYTSFYYISNNNILNYILALVTYYNITDKTILEREYEYVFPNFLLHTFNGIDTLGITQNISVWNDTTMI